MPPLIAVAAKPYARLSFTAHGELFEHVNAPPPLQPDCTLGLSGLSFLSQVSAGELTAALPGHAQEGLQQSQYLVEWPVPDTANTAVGAASSKKLMNDEADIVDVVLIVL